MMNARKYFPVLLLLMFSIKGFSQGNTLTVLNINCDSTHRLHKSSGFIFSPSNLLVKNPKNIVLNGFYSLETYKMGLGFFCKKELELDKITPMPIRFRLGSLEYVNWMERKLNSGNPVSGSR